MTAQTQQDFLEMLASLLILIEEEFRRLSIWEFETPNAAALESTTPFAVDTLSFTQWVQFIFIPRLSFLIEQQLALPQVSGIAPMAEEYFAPLGLPDSTLIGYFKQIDDLLSRRRLV